MHGSSSRHIANVRANDCYGNVENLNHLHKVWDQVGITSSGDWFNTTKERIRDFAPHLKIFKTQAAAEEELGASQVSVTVGSAMEAMVNQTGLRNILNPTLGAVASVEDKFSKTTAGIPPGA